MTGRRRHRPGAPPALPESMLDLIWILLFFFLTISTVKREEEENVLVEAAPYAGSDRVEPPEPRELRRLTILRDGTLNLDGEEVERQDLQGLLASGSDVNSHATRAIVIEVDRDARVEDLLAAEDAARAADVDAYVKRAHHSPQ